MSVASDACKIGWAREKSNSIWAEFQLASLRALLASLLSPSHLRPPHLAQGLDLFRRGSQHFRAQIAEYCMHALLALEVLIHPRALPLIDIQPSLDDPYGTGVKFLDNVHLNGSRHISSSHVGMVGKRSNEPESDADDLYKSWLENGEMEVHATDHERSAINVGDPSQNAKNPRIEKATNELLPNKNILEGESPGLSVMNATKHILVDKDTMMADTQTHELSKQSKEHNHKGEGSLDGEHSALESERVVTGSSTTITDLVTASGKGSPGAENQVMTTDKDMLAVPTSGNDVPVTQDDGYANIIDTISATISVDVSSDESIPDIVDGDPDSD